ncbi:MAG: hypothetical protein FWH21_00845 [Kiritimatiellaeota bacterium]|nr:hypothetical protein [Kiritimatiellota bacterium]
MNDDRHSTRNTRALAIAFVFLWMLFSFVFSAAGVVPSARKKFDFFAAAIACVPWLILIWKAVPLFRKGASAEAKANAKLFLRTVLWTFGILFLAGLLLLGMCGLI